MVSGVVDDSADAYLASVRASEMDDKEASSVSFLLNGLPRSRFSSATHPLTCSWFSPGALNKEG
jgi:hypothetical protein